MNDADDGPIDAGRRAWGDTRVALVPRRCYKVPYAEVTGMSRHVDSWGTLLMRGQKWRGVDLELADGSTLFVEVTGYPVIDAPNERRERFERGCEELEQLVRGGGRAHDAVVN